MQFELCYVKARIGVTALRDIDHNRFAGDSTHLCDDRKTWMHKLKRRSIRVNDINHIVGTLK